MKINNAKLCSEADCGELYIGPQCPCCASRSFAYLANWIEPLNSWKEAFYVPKLINSNKFFINTYRE